MTLKHILCILWISFFISCKNKPSNEAALAPKQPIVISFNNKAVFNKFKTLNLDSTYTNLLDPRNVSPSEYQEVTAAWSDFHNKVNNYLYEIDFKWEVTDSAITVFNKIYFDKNGAVDYYAFKVLNPGVSEEKQIEFEKILKQFSKEKTLNLKRDNQFAQCGKTKYINYSN